MAMIACLAVITVFSGCSKYDDSELRRMLEDHEKRLTALETLTKQLGDRLDAGAMITSITEITTAPGGWRITFTKGDPIEILNGTDGTNGKDGDSLIKSIVENADGTVTINLADGRSFTFTKVIVYNTFYIKGTERTTAQEYSAVEYRGPHEITSAGMIALTLRDEMSNNVINFNMRVAVGENRLTAGVYTYSFMSNQPGAISSGSSYDASEELWPINGGTVKVSVEGSGDTAVYTIEADCTLTEGGIATGTYRGTLVWYDAL